MKKKMFKKNLVLNKITIADLNSEKMRIIRGGESEFTCLDTCPCIEGTTDGNPPTILPCPTNPPTNLNDDNTV